MAFDFSLHSVLKVRALAEEREERMLQRILLEVAATKQAIAEAKRRAAELGGSRAADTHQTAAVLQAGYAAVEQLQDAQEEMEARLVKLEQLRDAQQTRYTDARRAREMLSEMRKEQRSAYDLQQSRQEQNVLDDNFNALARRRR